MFPRVLFQAMKNFPRTFSNITQKINSKWIKDLNVRPDAKKKLLVENIGRTCYEINCCNIFLDPPPSQRWRNSIKSEKTRPGADCGSDHELLIAKFRLKLKKVGKTTRPFRYDLNLFPYDYTVEVTNRSKVLDRVPEDGLMFVQEAVMKTIPKKKKCKRQNGCLRRP